MTGFSAVIHDITERKRGEEALRGSESKYRSLIETTSAGVTTIDLKGELKAGVKGHRRLFRKRLKAVATDRGFYSQANEDWLKGSVKQVSIPIRGKGSKQRIMEQKQPWFKRLQRFRAGCEGRISLLKRMFGLGRSLMRGNKGAEIWVGQGIFAHNLWQAARIM